MDIAIASIISLVVGFTLCKIIIKPLTGGSPGFKLGGEPKCDAEGNIVLDVDPGTDPGFEWIDTVVIVNGSEHQVGISGPFSVPYCSSSDATVRVRCVYQVTDPTQTIGPVTIVGGCPCSTSGSDDDRYSSPSALP